MTRTVNGFPIFFLMLTLATAAQIGLAADAPAAAKPAPAADDACDIARKS